MWFSRRQTWKMTVCKGRDISSVRFSRDVKNPSGTADLKGLKK